MTARLPEPVQNLIDSFNRLPGIGPKMAARLAFHLLERPKSETTRLVGALEQTTSGLQRCEKCANISAGPLCGVCRETGRNERLICVVEGPLDVIALDKTGQFHGVFHVLNGVLSPMDGIGPDQLSFKLFEERLAELVSQTKPGESVIEVIIATNPSLEGEATGSYLQQRIQNHVESGAVRITRIARGLPMGSDIEYADPSTLARALEGRNNYL